MNTYFLELLKEKREIKFRAWNTKKTINGKLKSVKEMVYFNLNELDEEYIVSSGTYLRGQYTLMQSIGLKDIHKQDIYEGDIVWCNDLEKLFFVHWEQESLSFVFLDHACDELMFPQRQTKQHYCSAAILVQGNVYEQPHLLEDL